AVELEHLRALYHAVAAGQGGRLVLISGEPGVGKTRLGQEIGLYAWGQRGLFLEGTYSRAGAASYGPWVDALRTSLRGLDREQLGPLVSVYGAELAPLFPELGAQFALPSPAVRPPEEQRRRLFDGLAELVTALSEQRPLVLLLNDLQWAPGLAPLIHLARRLGEIRALVLGTYREQEFKNQPGLVQDWSELNRGRLATQITLNPLSFDNTGRLITEYFGAEPAQQLSGLLYHRTRGNPFFLEEVFRSLTETGAVRAGPSGWEVADLSRVSVPESIKLVVEERVNRLGNSAREILIQAAVLGHEFSLPVLRTLTGEAEDVLFDTLDRAIAARLLLDVSVATEERFTFVDDQVQEVLYGTITPLRRRRTHLRAGQALEVLYADRLDRHLEELAHHFLTGGDLPKALDYTLRAGERAYALSDWDQSTRYFETVLVALEQLPDDLVRQVHTLDWLARLDNAHGRPGLEHSERALEIYLRLGDRLNAARMHRYIARAWGTGSAGASDMEKFTVHCEAAVELLEPEPDSLEKAEAFCGLSRALVHSRLDVQRARELGRKALAIAERLPHYDPTPVATYLAAALAFNGELVEAEQRAEQSWEASANSLDPFTRAAASASPVLWWPWRNDRVWAQRWVERLRILRQRYRIERFDRPAPGFSALTFALLGQPLEARDSLDEAGEVDARVPQVFTYLLGFAAEALAVLGDWEQADQLFERAYLEAQAAGSISSLVETARPYGRWLLAVGNLDRAGTVIGTSVRNTRGQGSVLQELNLLPLQCEYQVLTGQLTEAATSLERARELAIRLPLTAGLGAGVERAAGLLATAQRNWAEAERAFSGAVSVEVESGFPYHEAQHLVPWAELYFQRNEPGDRERGLEKLDQALAIFKRCAAKPDIEKALARRAQMSP
ncbi:MAG: AAA family ATPase, partial [Chloroflexi bacterium]|nr:AAA family ATPase [Chloroflexota bacterium]